jgi:hypothetical protein
VNAQGLFRSIYFAVKCYLDNFAPACISLALTPALAEAPPTLAFTPTPHCSPQHFFPSCLHDPHPSQQQPDVAPTMATAITTIIELTFIDYLTFFTSVAPEPISGLTAK